MFIVYPLRINLDLSLTCSSHYLFSLTFLIVRIFLHQMPKEKKWSNEYNVIELINKQAIYTLKKLGIY